MPEEKYTVPMDQSEVLGDENYINGDYNYKTGVLDGLENHNLRFLENEKVKRSGETSSDGAYDYATEVGNWRAGIRNKRYEALDNEFQKRITNLSQEYDVPAETALDSWSEIAHSNGAKGKNENPELDNSLKELYNWHLGQQMDISSKSRDNIDSPFTTRAITNAQGVNYGEEKVFRGADGNAYGVVKFSTDEEGQPVKGDNPKDSSHLIKLDTDVSERVNQLHEEQTQKQEEANKIEEQLKHKPFRGIAGPIGPSFGDNVMQDRLASLKKDLNTIGEKINNYSDGTTGLTNYLHDQMELRLRTDDALRSRLPSGGDFKFTTDMGIGAVQGGWNVAAAANLMVGNKDTAKSLAREAQEMDAARSAFGLGKERNSEGTTSLLATTASDQIPMLLTQMGYSKLVAGAATRTIEGMAAKGLLGSEVAGLSEEALSAVSKRWGNKIGAFVGSLPTTAQDAAGNLAHIYDQVDKMEAQAKAAKTPEERDSLLKKAQGIEDHEAALFMAHFVSVGALEYIPAEHYLERFTGDLPLAAKVFRGASKLAEPAARTAEAAAKYEVLQSRLSKFWATKLGQRTLGGLTQGSSEAITEVVQQMSDNNIAKSFYDENQDIMDGVAPAGLAGLFLGGSIGYFSNVTKKHAVIQALNRHTSDVAAAQNNVIAMTNKFLGQALKDGTIAHPADEVVKHREDGKYVIDDPTMPVDAVKHPEFDNADDAKAYASNRWEEYGKQKIRDIYAQTEHGKTEQGKADTENTIAAISAMAQGTANGASKETIWKSLSQSMQFKDSPNPQANLDSALPYLDKILGNKDSALRGQLDDYAKQVNEWNAKNPLDRGPKPQPQPELAVALDFTQSRTGEQVSVDYPNVDTAHENIMMAIPKMSDQQLQNDIFSRRSRIEKLAQNMSKEQQTKVGSPLFKMYREQKAALDEFNRRKDQGNKAPATQAGTEGTTQTGTQQASGEQADVGAETTLNQGPAYKGDITNLGPNDVFVFGSNPQGFHGAGSAGFASFGKKGNNWKKVGYDTLPNGTKGKWNVKGQGEGLQTGTEGTSYALPTVAKAGAKRSLTPEQITANIKKMYAAATANPTKTFKVAQGAEGGLNGYSGKEMAKMFADAGPIPSNVSFNEEFNKLFPSNQVDVNEDPITHFPKEFQQFMKEVKTSIEDYNKALLGQQAKEQEQVNERTKLKELLKAGKGDVLALRNADGTLNVDEFLSQVPEGTPMGDLAALLREVLPLVPAEDRSIKFNINEKASGITNTDGTVVVGEGVGAYDTVGGEATVSEIIGAMLPRMVDIIVSPKLNATKKSIEGRKPLSRDNASSNWKGGNLKEESGSPSALELRAIFEIAMPGAFTDRPGMDREIKTAEQMKKLVVRAELARMNPDGLIPESIELMDDIAMGRASVGPDAPSDKNTTRHHVQKTADGRMIFWENTGDGWSEVPVTMKARAREKFTTETTMGKMAALYLRQVVSHGHFDTLFGHTVQDAKGKTFYDGAAATPLTKAEYKEKYARQSEKMPPWEMTSFSRFFAGMISNPEFSMSMDKGMNWALPIKARQSAFRSVVGGLLGGDAKAPASQEATAIIGAATLAANAKKYKESLKNGPAKGIPGPTPIGVSTAEHQRRLESAARGAANNNRTQDVTGNDRNTQYDQDGNPVDHYNEDLQLEASDMGASVRMERNDIGQGYTEEQGRKDQAEGYSTSITPLQRHLAEEDIDGNTQDGLTQQEADENNARIVSETNSFFELQLALAEQRGDLKVDRKKEAKPQGERAIGLVLKRMQKIQERSGVQEGDSPQVALNKFLTAEGTTKTNVDTFIKRVKKYITPEQVDEIARTFHDSQRDSVRFKTAMKEAVDAAYKAYDKEVLHGRKKLTEEERRLRKGAGDKAREVALLSITPEGYNPKMFVTPSSTSFGDKVDTRGQGKTERTNFVGSPVISAPGNQVLVASVNGGYSERELQNYISEMSYGRLNQVHDALVQLAKAFGIKLNDKDTYKNSKKDIRIKTDSLGVYGALETALYALNKASNPVTLDTYLKSILFPGTPSQAKLVRMLRADPSLLSDMHALASGFMDSIGYGLKEEGKRVMLKTDAAVFGWGKPDQEGNRQGELQTQEEEVSGPYVAMDANEMTNDTANMSKAYPTEYAAATARSFRMRPTRFSARGASASAVHMNGVIPFFVKNSGDQVAITDQSKWNALGGRSVGEVFKELANQLDINADQKALFGVYKKIWAQVFTTSESGMKALRNMKKQVDAIRESTNSQVPMVSPENGENQAFGPADAIAQLINDYVPSGEKTKGKQDVADTKTVDEAGDTSLPEVSDSEVGLDQPNRNAVPRAQIAKASRMITIFKNGDPTSLVHEMVHWMRFTKLRDGSSLFQNALGGHYTKFMEWATEGGKHDPKSEEGFKIVEERIAEGAEEYLRAVGNEDSGSAKRFFEKMGINSPAMVTAFKKVANMFRRIYDGLKSFVQLDNNARAGYDRLFGASERVIPVYSKPVTLSFDELKVENVKERAQRLVAAAAQIGAQVTTKDAAEAIAAEEKMASEPKLIPDQPEGGPEGTEDPDTLLYQTIPAGLGAAGRPYNPGIKGSLQKLWRDGQKAFAKWFVATEGMEWDVKNIMHIKLAGARQSFERDYLKYSTDLTKAIKKHLGEKFPISSSTSSYDKSVGREELHRQINGYLTEKDPAVQAGLLAALPTDKIKMAAATIRAHVDALSSMLISTGIAQGPIATVIDANKGSYLHRSYEIFTDPKRGKKLQTGNLNLIYRSAIQSIMDTRGVTEDIATEIANNILEVGKAEQQKVKASDPRARGVGVLMEEKNPFPDLAVARDLLWGFKEDPIYNYQNTAKQMGYLLQSNAAISELLNYGTTGPDPLIVPATQPNPSKTVELVPFFGDPERVDPATNPIMANIQTRLAGWKTTEEVATFVREALVGNQNIADGSVKGYMQFVNTVNGLFKVNATVLNWETGMRNFYSSTMTMFANGHVAPIHWANSIRLMWNEGLGIEQTNRNEALMQELMKYNIADGATIAEIKDFARKNPDADKMYEKFLTGNHHFGRQGDELAKSVMSGLTAFKQGSMNLYNGFDTIAKITAYLSEKDKVKEMFPSMTPSQVQEEASRRTHLTMFSFDMNPRFINMMRNTLPLSGPFTSFVWAMTRTGVNILKLGTDDIITGGKRKLRGDAGGAQQMLGGAARLGAFLTTVGSGKIAGIIAQSLLGWSDDDMDSLHDMVAPFDKNGTLIPLGSKYGKSIEYVNMTNILPYSVYADAIFSLLREDGQGAADKIQNATEGLWKPFVDEQYITQAYRVIKDKRNRYGEELNGWKALTAELTRPLIPGHITNLARLDLAKDMENGEKVGDLQESFGIRPTPMGWERKSLMAVGVRTNKIDKEDLIRWKAQEYLGNIKSAASEFNFHALTTPNVISREAWSASLQKAIDAQTENVKEANRVFSRFQSGFLVLPDTMEDVLKQVTERSGHVSGNKFNAEQIEAIQYGGVIVPSIKISQQQYDNAIEAAQNAKQIERAAWLMQAEAEGKIEVQAGR